MVDPKQYEYKKEVFVFEQVPFSKKENQISQYEVRYRFFCEESSEEIILKHEIECFKKDNLYIYEHYFCPILLLSHTNITLSQTMKFIFDHFSDFIDVHTKNFESHIFIHLRKM
ncbi:hypothetical protein [Bacillus cereus]|uniref:hypothetical protein n=1 Tax=Bacillus cereus TaxID=1396 RepID=UPI000BEC21BE|nr:hypothetical protein [Bacillus cereus]PDY82765.1 hypothetical protein CON06_10195 [Bacillus cereus]